MGRDPIEWRERGRRWAGRMPLLGWALVAAVGVGLADGLPEQAGTPAGYLCGWGVAVAVLWGVGAPRRLVAGWGVLVLAGGLHWSRQGMAPGRRLAAALPAQGSVVWEVCGRVAEVPVEISSSPRVSESVFVCVLEGLHVRGDFAGSAGLAQEVVRGARVWVRWKGEPPLCGARVWVRAGVHRIASARNPGQWDAAAYFRRRGLWVEMQMRDALDGAVLEWPVGFSLETWLGGMRAAVVRELGRGLEQPPTAHALIASMVLGLRGDGLEQEQEWFRQTGTLHLFAVSGLNLAMLATFLMAVTRVCFLGPRVVPVVVAPVLVVYAAVTGGSASCVRALVMSLMGLLAVCVGRSPVTLNSLGAAALVLLVWDGNVLFRPAFQLSFWMVLALSWVSGTLGRQLRNWARPDVLLPRAYWSAWQNTRMRLWQPVADALAVSLGAWIAGLPAAVLLFHELAPVAILANLLLTPLAFGILALGFTALFASPLGRFSDILSGATPLLNRMNGHCADAVLWGVRFCSALPGAHWVIGEPWREPPDFIVFDVGEGAAVMVRFGATAFLLDCAREEQVRTVLLPAFRLYGLGELAGLILSHGDVHHVGGGIFLMEQLAVRSVVLPAVGDRSTARRRVEDWLGRHAGTAVERVSAGWGRQIGPGHTLEVLYPPADLRAALSDDKGLVVRWVSPHGSLLYTADAGFPTELWLLRHCADRLAADVWVRGQHGREKTGLEDFVRAVSPRVIVAGVPGRRAPRGSQQGWADPWFREGRTVFLQKDSGAVEGFWNGKRWDVRGFCSGPVRATPPEEAEGPGPQGERP